MSQAFPKETEGFFGRLGKDDFFADPLQGGGALGDLQQEVVTRFFVQYPPDVEVLVLNGVRHLIDEGFEFAVVRIQGSQAIVMFEHLLVESLVAAPSRKGRQAADTVQIQVGDELFVGLAKGRPIFDGLNGVKGEDLDPGQGLQVYGRAFRWRDSLSRSKGAVMEMIDARLERKCVTYCKVKRYKKE